MSWWSSLPVFGSVIDSTIGYERQKRNIRRQQRFDREMADLAFMHNKHQMHQSAVYDANSATRAFERDVEMWNRQNEYNNPSSQMERLKSAGLNPHLVYGNGVTGNITSSPPKMTPTKRGAAEYTPPQTDLALPPIKTGIADAARVLLEFQDLELKKAQTDNVTANTENINARTAIDIVRKSGVISDNQKKKIEAQIVTELAPTSVDTGKIQLKNLKRDMINKTWDSMLKDREANLKDIDIKWRKKGMTQNDAIMWRMLAKMLESLGMNPFNLK